MIGASAKGAFRDWNKTEWEERYSDIEIIPQIEFHLEQSNIIQQ